MPGWYFAHVWDEYESMHFAQAQTQIFAWRSPYETTKVQAVEESP